MSNFFAIPYEKCLSYKSNKVEKNVFDSVSIKETNFTYPFEQVVVEDDTYNYYDIISDPVYRSDVENGEDYPSNDTFSHFMYSWGDNKFYRNFIENTLTNPNTTTNIRYRDFFVYKTGNIQLPGDFANVQIIGSAKTKEIEYEYGHLNLVVDYNDKNYTFETQDRLIQIVEIEQFVESKRYYVLDYVVYGDKIYQCDVGTTIGEWNASDWVEISPIEPDVFPYLRSTTNDTAVKNNVHYYRLPNVNESNEGMQEHPIVYFAYGIKTSPTGVKTLEYLLINRLFTADYFDGDYDKDETHNQYYTMDLELKIVVNTKVEKTSNTLVEKRKNAVLYSLELPSNEFINNLSTIRLYGENENRPLAKTLVNTIFEEYKGGKETLRITLPEITLYDLFGNEVIKKKNGVTANSFIRSNDTFVMTRFGDKMSDKIFLVTSVEQEFDGATRFYIKAKEKSKDYNFQTFEPILWVWQGKTALKNYDEYVAMLNEQGINIEDVNICLVVKKHHIKRRVHRNATISPKYQPFGSTYSVSVGHIRTKTSPFYYEFDFGQYYGLNYITGIDDLLWGSSALTPKDSKSTYHLYKKNGEFAPTLQIGICFEYNGQFTKKSVNCYHKDNNAQYKLKNSWDENS